MRLAEKVWLYMLTALAVLSLTSPATAHDLPYALAEIETGDDGQTLVVSLYSHIPALVLREEPRHLTPPSRAILLAMDNAELASRVDALRHLLEAEFYAEMDGRDAGQPNVILPSLAEIRNQARQTAETAERGTPVLLTFRRHGGDMVSLAGPAWLGSVAVRRIVDGEGGHLVFAAPAEKSKAISLRAQPKSNTQFGTFLWQGFLHVLPGGLDHVLFIVCLALGTQSLRRLVILATGFTVAHTLALGLAVLGTIPAPASIIEPLIAASIVLLALYKIWHRDPHRGFFLLIFAIGLLHGLGFASALTALGLPQGHEILALVAFNIGVELAQIAVILITVLLTRWMQERAWYRRRVIIPGLLAISTIGSIWIVQRTILA